jgi:hypothetical protein
MIPIEIRRAAHTVAQKSRGELCPQDLMNQWMRNGVPEYVQTLIDSRAAQHADRQCLAQERRLHTAHERRSHVRPRVACRRR